MKIVLMRHGRPKIDQGRFSRPNEIADFIKRYDAAGLDLSVPPPSGVVELARTCHVVVCSDLSRSLASAERLGVPARVRDPVFREVLIPCIDLKFPRLPISVWVVVLRSLQMLGFNRGTESMGQARVRAQRCAQRLDKLATSDDSVLFAGHAFLNWLIAKELEKMGWSGSYALGQSYWGFSEFYLDARA